MKTPDKKPAKAVWWAPVVVAAAIAFALGIFGGHLVGSLTGALFGEPGQTPLEDAGNIDRRTDRLAGDAPAPALPAGPAPDPEPVAEVVEKAEIPNARAAERLALAYDSPLTPPVTEAAERIRRHAEARQDTDEAANATGPDTAEGLHEPDQGLDHDPDDAPVLHVLARGSVVSAVLESAIDSELPGLVRAQVTQDVYDSLSGSHVLIPRGSRLVGTYRRDTDRRRLFVSWDELRLPDGTPVRLDDFSTLGPDGASGVKGRRSTGFVQALGATVLFNLAGNATTILTSATGIAAPQSELGGLLSAALGNSTSQVTSDYIGSLLGRSARFRIRVKT